MIVVDPLLYKLLEFWAAIASIWVDGFMLFVALVWLADWRKDRADMQARILGLLFGLSALLAFLFFLCMAKVIVPMRLL